MLYNYVKELHNSLRGEVNVRFKVISICTAMHLHYAQKHCLKSVFFNDAGIGKNNAGIKSLDTLSEAGILACPVDCMSAEIFNGQDTLENGIVSVTAISYLLCDNLCIRDFKLGGCIIYPVRMV